MLKNYLYETRISFRHIHFPRLNEGFYGKLVAEFLRGDFGSNDIVHPKLVALLFAGDRKDFADTIRQWLDEGHLVIADRYVYSNIAFQCAKLKDEGEKERLRQWILETEFQYYAIPRPDVSLFLNVPIKASTHALTQDDQRDQREYLAGAEDIHEADSDFQARVYHEYLTLVASEKRFYGVECVDKTGNRLSPSDTHQMIIRKLQEMQIFR